MLAYSNVNCNKLINRQESAVEHVKLVKFNHSPNGNETSANANQQSKSTICNVQSLL